jgi:inorganic pyrophosphatase
MMVMLDGGKEDEKVIAIPVNDPLYNEYKCLEELPKHIADEMIHFFSVYKDENENKTLVEKTIVGVEDTKLAIAEAKNRYKKNFPNK